MRLFEFVNMRKFRTRCHEEAPLFSLIWHRRRGVAIKVFSHYFMFRRKDNRLRHFRMMGS